MNLLTPLNIPAAKSGDWEIVVKTEPSGKEFQTANMRCQMFGGQKSKKVSWPFETRWHYLKEGGGTWMSDLPCEHAQVLQCIKGMRGRVLVGGLGLGLAATLLAKKKAVKEVIVVEKSSDVIKLVYEHIRRRDIFDTKIIVLEADLFDYLKGCIPNQFDYAFYDIWQSDGEGTFFEVVCPLYDLSRGKVKNLPEMWNVDVMRGQLCSSIMNRLLFMRPGAMEHLDPEGKLAKQPKPWEPAGTIWHDWMVPFFSWWKEAEPTEEQAQTAARYYAGLYGIPDWEKRWEWLVKTLLPATTELENPDAVG